jgi:hypothetical protein
MGESIFGASPSRQRLALIAILLAGTVAGVLSLKAQRAAQPPAESKLKSYLDGLHASGAPVTLQEAYGPEPPDAENAAPEIAATYAQIRAEFGDESTWSGDEPWDWCTPGGIGTATPERIAALREFMSRLDAAVRRIDAALDRPRLRFPLNVGPDGSPTLDRLRVVPRLEMILIMDARITTDPARCIERCRVALRLARRDEPLGLGDVIPNAATSQSVASVLRRWLSSGDVDPADVRRRLEPWLAGSWLQTMANELRRERAHCISVAGAFAPPPAYSGEDRQEFDRRVIADCEVLTSVSALPLIPNAAYRRKAMDALRRAESGGAVSEFGTAVERVFRDEAACRLCRVALAVAEHRAKHGDFPATLDELKWAFPDEIPPDPYTDAPFVYERTAAGVRISSAGHLAGESPPDAADLRERLLVWELKR